MAQLNFDATQTDPDFGFDVLPAGWYNVMIDQSELKPTKDGLGRYLEVRFSVMEGQYQNRKFFSRLNIQNANPTAQEIALRQLSAIAHAVGVLHVQDSSQLHGIPMKVKVKVRKGEGDFEDSNEILAYRNINEPVETVGSGGPATVAGFGNQTQPQGFGQSQGGFNPQQQPNFQQQGQPQQPQQATQPPAQQQQPAFQGNAAPAQQPWSQPPAAGFAQQTDHQNPFQQQGTGNAVQTAQGGPAGNAGSAEQPWNSGGAQPWNGQGQPQQQQPQEQVQQQSAPPLNQQAQSAVQSAETAPPPWATQG